MSVSDNTPKKTNEPSQPETTASSPDKSTVQPGPPLDLSKKTTGEKYYDVVQFLVGKAWIMAFTAAIAYSAKYGKDQWGPMPNPFKKFQGWFHDFLLHNKTFPLAEKGEFAGRLAGATANTMVLFHGGNIFAPVMKWMENGKEDISNYFNRRYGKPGEVEIAHERLKDMPKQDWGDVLKGRIAAWLIVFTSFVTIDSAIGKDKKTGLYWFDKYEEGFGRWLAGFTKEGKKIGIKMPVSQELSVLQDANKTYRFGKIAALDVYATTAAIFIWNAISRMSAKKQQERNRTAAQAENHDAASADAAVSAPDATGDKSCDACPVKKTTGISHAEALMAQRQAEPLAPAMGA